MSEESIYEMRQRAAQLRREADDLDARAVSLAATNHEEGVDRLRAHIRDLEAKLKPMRDLETACRATKHVDAALSEDHTHAE